MKIIFLDMDGVLCTNRAHVAQGLIDPENHGYMDALDREAVGMLNKLQEKHPDILYVLSSTWRKLHPRAWMEQHLRKYNWKGEFHPDWKTDAEGIVRGEEIQRWLDAHRDVDTYVILDDDSDMLDKQNYHFVKTDSYNGITAENYWHMERIFQNGNMAGNPS